MVFSLNHPCHNTLIGIRPVLFLSFQSTNLTNSVYVHMTFGGTSGNAVFICLIIKLPPYSPELNPIEQVWSWLRQNHLANRCFSGYDDIVDASSIDWNDFASDVKRVTTKCVHETSLKRQNLIRIGIR
jgi:hypothetical protein